MPNGYNGKILRVDLTNKKIDVDEHDENFYRTYGGSSCLGAYYLLKEMSPGVDPLGPDNLFFIGGSVVNGAPVPGFCRTGIVSKSPLTGAIADTQAGGYFGPELKFAGFDAIVINGKADSPVYLWIHDGEVEIRDASHIWGKTTGEAQEAIREELDDSRVIVAGIGQAGENLVKFACVVNNLKHANGRLGMGAVMGSKNLKAIAVRGKDKLDLYDRKSVLNLAKELSANFMDSPDNKGLHDLGTAQYVMGQNDDGQLPTRNWLTGQMAGAEKVSGQTMTETVLLKNEGCFACPIKCKRVVQAEEPYKVDPAYGGPEYETIGALGSYCEVNDLVAICKANELCNKYGLDTISAGQLVAFAMECYEKGILNDTDTGGIKLKFGDADAMLQLVEKIAFREGLGDILADGVKLAAEKIGKGSEKFACHVKGEELPAHDARAKGHLALSYALSPIGADHIVAEHDSAFTPDVYEATSFFADRVKPLGILEPLPLETIDHKKVRRFFYFQSVFSFMDTLTLCIFTLAPCRYYTFQQLVDLVNGITGWDTSLWELMKMGERRVAMFRAFNIREGFVKDDDWLPDRMFEGILSGPREGQKVDKGELKEAIDLYYEMAGWNSEGVPTKGKFAELDLYWIAEEMVKIGKYA